MALTVDNTYSGPSVATATQIDRAFTNRGKLILDLGRLINKWCPSFDFRSEGVGGQVSEETGWGTNFWTLKHNNIMSIGVTGEVSTTPRTGADWQIDATPNGTRWLRGYSFPTVEAGLIAGLIHMAYYVYGRDKNNWPVGARQFYGDTVADPRLPVLLTTNLPGTIKYFRDMGSGRYATAAHYGIATVGRANLILGTEVPITRALGIPGTSQGFYTWLRNKGIRVVEDYVADGWVGRGGMQPEAIVHHVTDGLSVNGSIGWWRRADIEGSTQQIVAGVNDPDYADGSLVITRKDEDTAWGNGAWGNPNLSLPTIKRWYTQNINPNRVTLSREHSGKPFRTDFPSDKAMLTSFYGDLHWMAKYPLIQPDRAHLLKHADIDSINRSNCPGPRFNLDKLIAEIVAALQNEKSDRYETALQMWLDISSGKVSVFDAWPRYFSGR